MVDIEPDRTVLFFKTKASYICTVFLNAWIRCGICILADISQMLVNSLWLQKIVKTDCYFIYIVLSGSRNFRTLFFFSQESLTFEATTEVATPSSVAEGKLSPFWGFGHRLHSAESASAAPVCQGWRAVHSGWGKALCELFPYNEPKSSHRLIFFC